MILVGRSTRALYHACVMLAPMSSPRNPQGGDPSDEQTTVDPEGYEGDWEESTVEERGRGTTTSGLARLLVTAGADRGREFELRERETSVGRGTMNGIILTDLAVSRRHLVIVADAEIYRLRDLGSGNGTEVNGDPVSGEVPLRDGDSRPTGSRAARDPAAATAAGRRLGGDDPAVAATPTGVAAPATRDAPA